MRHRHTRILMYSHDSFGLGHLRRCRAIAHALVQRISGLHILIISGSPIAGAFDFRVRVDFVKIPSVIKLHSGEYKSMMDHIDLDETLQMRRAMIHDTARSFEPDIMIVDKEPLGLQGELEATLHDLKASGTQLVLGLRDVMDSPELLKQEWLANDMVATIERLYDHVWVYGPESFWNPLQGFEVSDRLAKRITYTGFLERKVPSSTVRHFVSVKDYILVTAGGGGDGADLLKNVIAAYEHDTTIRHDAVMVLGPFMPAGDRDKIFTRAEKTGRIVIIEFDALIEKLIVNSAAMIGMCGYNTFCEMLSFDKRSLIIPRIRPRKEQYVRAKRAQDLGLVSMLTPQQAADSAAMASAMHELLAMPVPSSAGADKMLGGLGVISDLTQAMINPQDRPALSVIEGGLN